MHCFLDFHKIVGSDERKEDSLMFRKWMQLVGVSILAISLSGCGKSLETQIDSGLSLTNTVYADEPKETNEKVGNIQFFIPNGYTIEDKEEDVNILLSKGQESYILFVNEKEGADSQLHYENLKQDASKDIVEDQTFEKDGVFGFSAVIKNSKDAYELVVSLGGVKMTTISPEEKIEGNLEDMLKIVRSVKLKETK